MSDQPTGRYSLGLTDRLAPAGSAFSWRLHRSRDSHIPECFSIMHVSEQLLPC